MVSQEQFDNKLLEIMSNLKADFLLTIPGIYEIVSEEFNNEIIEKIEKYEEKNHD